MKLETNIENPGKIFENAGKLQKILNNSGKCQKIVGNFRKIYKILNNSRKSWEILENSRKSWEIPENPRAYGLQVLELQVVYKKMMIWEQRPPFFRISHRVFLIRAAPSPRKVLPFYQRQLLLSPSNKTNKKTLKKTPFFATFSDFCYIF